MNEQQIAALIRAMGFEDQGTRGIEDDARYRHCSHGASSKLTSEGSIYIKDDRITATGPYVRILETIQRSNGRCDHGKAPAWSGSVLSKLLQQMPQEFSPCP